jgi:hypothetical protein
MLVFIDSPRAARIRAEIVWFLEFISDYDKAVGIDSNLSQACREFILFDRKIFYASALRRRVMKEGRFEIAFCYDGGCKPPFLVMNRAIAAIDSFQGGAI